MGFMLTSHLRATSDAAVHKMRETNMANLRNCKLVNELADPELTAVYAESQNKKRPASRVLLSIFRHKIVMSCVPHTIDAVQTSLLGHIILASHAAYRKACHGRAAATLHLCEEVQVAQHGRLPVVFLWHWRCELQDVQFGLHLSLVSSSCCLL